MPASAQADPLPAAFHGGLSGLGSRPPLSEILPAAPGDGAAALGFALAWAQALSPGRRDGGRDGGLIVWAAPEASFGEEGVPYAPGLAQYGLALERLFLVRARSQADALWAAEQTLKIPAALALVTIWQTRKPLSLTATRRLLLIAEKHRTACVLLRFDGGAASAAWARWRVRAAPSKGANRELGAPAFNIELLRNRAGPAGFSTSLVWNAHARTFNKSMDGDLAAAAGDRPAAPRRLSA
ncbi:MAG: hypothetical protein JNJ73_00035 [Hyphomonadaceae bacterium]|nr:hypothetical protein [Hyphomonadaceae bacterium]